MSENDTPRIDRRTLIKSASGVALGLAAAPVYAAVPRKRFAIIGLGSRSRMYVNAITGKYKDGNELTALCDSNPGRLDLAARGVTAAGVRAPRKYLAADFDRMIRETR